MRAILKAQNSRGRRASQGDVSSTIVATSRTMKQQSCTVLIALPLRNYHHNASRYNSIRINLVSTAKRQASKLSVVPGPFPWRDE